MFKTISITKLRFIFFLLAFIIGIINAWSVRNVVDFDGIPNLDIGDAVFRGNYNALINGMWSPLYPLVLGFFLNLIKPCTCLESTVIHFINFFIYILTFFCFDFFLNQFIYYVKQKESYLSKNNFIVFPEWLWLILGYTLFIWSSMNLITLSRIMPDMCVAAFVYLIIGILLKIKTNTTNWFTFIFSGIVFALSYYSKAFMFPMVFLFLTISIFLSNFKYIFPRIIISFFIFILLTTPYIFYLSQTKGHFTFGETGKVNYAEEVMEKITINPTSKNNYPQINNLTHPLRKIFDKIAVYEYSTPFNVTYPPWYDPTYWWDGLKLEPNLKGQFRAIARSVKVYADLIFQTQGILLVLLILYFFSKRGLLCFKDISEVWFLLIPFLIVSVLYSLVHVEFRYIGAYLIIFLLGLFSTLKLPDSMESKRVLKITTTTITCFILITSLISLDFLDNFKNNAAEAEWKVSEALKTIGLKEGYKVAVIPGECDVYWARLAKLHIISEVSLEDWDLFWTSSDEIKTKVLKIFKDVGAKVVVAYDPPKNVTEKGWINIKDTEYYYYILNIIN